MQNELAKEIARRLEGLGLRSVVVVAHGIDVNGAGVEVRTIQTAAPLSADELRWIHGDADEISSVLVASDPDLMNANLSDEMRADLAAENE